MLRVVDVIMDCTIITLLTYIVWSSRHIKNYVWKVLHILWLQEERAVKKELKKHEDIAA